MPPKSQVCRPWLAPIPSSHGTEFPPRWNEITAGARASVLTAAAAAAACQIYAEKKLMSALPGITTLSAVCRLGIIRTTSGGRKNAGSLLSVLTMSSTVHGWTGDPYCCGHAARMWLRCLSRCARVLCLTSGVLIARDRSRRLGRGVASTIVAASSSHS